MMLVKNSMLTKLQLFTLNVTTCIFVLYNVFNRYIIDGRRVNIDLFLSSLFVTLCVVTYSCQRKSNFKPILDTLQIFQK